MVKRVRKRRWKRWRECGRRTWCKVAVAVAVEVLTGG